MFNISPEKMLVLGILALVILGPERMPMAARNLGRVLGQFRRMSGGFQAEIRDALAEPRQALQHAVDEFGIEDLRTSVRGTFLPTTPTPPARGDSPAGEAGPSATPPPPGVAPSPTPTGPGNAPDDPSFN